MRRYPAHLGHQSHLACSFEGAELRTEWRRENDARLPLTAHQNDGNLIIEETGYDAAGIYECLGIDHTGRPVVLERVELFVLALPRITLSPEMPLVVRPNDQVVIFCNASGDQPLHIRWHTEDHGYFPSGVRASGQYLTFPQISLSDTGKYYCTASNAYGNTTKAAEVIVNSKY